MKSGQSLSLTIFIALRSGDHVPTTSLRSCKVNLWSVDCGRGGKCDEMVKEQLKIAVVTDCYCPVSGCCVDLHESVL